MNTSTMVDIQVGNLEEELSHLWEEQKSKNQVRACLFNLIIFSRDQRKAAYLHQVVQTILEKYPSRIIFIQGNAETTQEYLRAMAGNLIIAKGETTIACDQVNIDVTLDQLHRVPSVVLPLIVPDLPVYLVWGENPALDTIILPRLQSYASRLIFDSDCTENLQEYSEKILSLLNTSQIEVRDVRWAAFGGWRAVLSQVFNTQGRISALQHSKRIDIFFNSLKTTFVNHPEVQVIYLQAWLAVQMGWTIKKVKHNEMTYSSGSNDIVVTLIPQEIPALSAGSIAGVHVHSDEGLQFILERKDTQPKVSIHITSTDRCEMPFNLHLDEFKKVSVMMTEIFYRRTSPHYQAMLEMISKTHET